MDLTSEQVHWIGGAAFVVVSLLMLVRASGLWRWQWIPWLLPALFVGYGLESVADVWIHGDAVPVNYAAETRQHLLQGGSLFVAGVVEALVLSGRLSTPIWRLAVPMALAVTATVFAAHAQHGGSADAAAMALMQVQHRGFAIALFTAAAARGAEVLMTRSAASRHAPGATASQDSPARLRDAWLLPLLIFGLLMLTYTEQEIVRRGAALLVVGDERSSQFPAELAGYRQRCAGGIKVNFLVNYGWEWDLDGLRTGQLHSEQVSRMELIVRWGGGRRLSGFLPVQSVYADIYVVDELWPDFDPSHLDSALAWFQKQDRTLGG